MIVDPEKLHFRSRRHRRCSLRQYEPAENLAQKCCDPQSQLVEVHPDGSQDSWSYVPTLKTELAEDQPSLIKPDDLFSGIRLSDVLHREACALVQPAVVSIL